MTTVIKRTEVLAIGAGPSNLALAVALEELGDDVAEHTLVVEKSPTIAWQDGLLLPAAKSQVSFVKDLVTLRNPRSRFSFLKYLHETSRLDDFANLGTFIPYRAEISDYLRWVAESLAKVRVELGRACVGVEPVRDRTGAVQEWSTTFADGGEIRSRYLAIGVGRDACVPEAFRSLPDHRVIHSTRYRQRIGELSRDGRHRVAVVGSAQSAAEIFQAVQSDLPCSTVTWIMRAISPRPYEQNRFTNELFFPSFVDEFFDARPEGREQIMREMHRTNYSGVEPHLLESLYRARYLGRVAGDERTRMISMTDVVAAREEGDEVVLTLRDRRTGAMVSERYDLIVLGTGFVRAMPRLVRDLAAKLDGTVRVDRNYRLQGDDLGAVGCYLQGVNEATHGISDSLLSVVAARAADIARDIIRHRSEAGLIHA